MQVTADEAAKALLCEVLKISEDEFHNGKINFAGIIRDTPLLDRRRQGRTLFKQLCMTDYGIARCGGRASKELMDEFMGTCSTILTSKEFMWPALRLAAACFYVHYKRNPAHE